MQNIGKKIVSTLFLIILVYLCFIAGLYLSQRQMLFVTYPDKPDINATGLAGIQTVTVEAKDGVKIEGWYLPPSAPNKSVLVFFHGNGSNIGWAANRMPEFIKQGYGFLLAEYRGYAGNPGHPSEDGVYNDARAYIDWLIEKGVPEGNIILYGESLGTGVAVQMALEYKPFQAIVLEAPFTSAVDIASKLYWYVPVPLLMRDKFDSYAKIEAIRSPLIIVHGTRDHTIPPYFVKKLFDRAPNPKTLITLEGAGHNDLGSHGAAQKILGALSE